MFCPQRRCESNFLRLILPAKIRPERPATWTNHLTIRNRFDENTRKLEILVAPRGTIRYTLDGSEARNGTDYSQPLVLHDSAQSVYVFAECEGVEGKRTFQFAAKGRQEIEIKKEKPAQIYSPTPKRLDNSAKTYEGLKLAKEKGITFEQVTLQIGSSPKVIHLSLGEMRIQAEFLETGIGELAVSPLVRMRRSFCPLKKPMHPLALIWNSLPKPLVSSLKLGR